MCSDTSAYLFSLRGCKINGIRRIGTNAAPDVFDKLNALCDGQGTKFRGDGVHGVKCTTSFPEGVINAMATSLTLKNIPDEVYQRLSKAAEMHRRSLNSEAIACLEAALVPSTVTPRERLARARRLRAELGTVTFDASDIDAYKRQGRS
jgi:plasmid stability protein